MITGPVAGRWFAQKQQEATEARQEYDRSTPTDGSMDESYAIVSGVTSEIGKLINEASVLIEALKNSRERLAGRLGGENNIPSQVQETYAANADAVVHLEKAQQALRGARQSLTQFQLRLT